MSISKRLLQKDLESKWCRSCQSYREHVGGTLCVECALDEEDVEWYIENVESKKEAAEPKEMPDPETPQSLDGVKEGDEIFLSSGVTTTVTEVTSRSVKTSIGSFVKSDGTGWGSNELDAAPTNT